MPAPELPWRLGRRRLLRLLAAAPLAGVLPSVLAACARPLAGQRSAGQAEGWLPPPAEMPGSLLVVDLNGVSLDQQVALAIMEGLVNARLRRGGEGLYLLLPSNYVGGVAFQGADQRWLTVYSQQYGIRARNGQPADAVALAKQSGLTGYVIWDPAVPATINVANTLAWLRGTLAVAPEDAGTALRGPAAELAGGLSLDSHGFTQALDLRQQNFSGASAAYAWALQQLGTQRPDTLAFLSVGDLPGDATEGVIRWTPRDYAVVARAFSWVGQLGSGTPATLGQLFTKVAGAKTTAFGWTNNEAQQTILCSGNGVNFVGADTPGLSAENLSVHSAIRATARQKPLPTPPTLAADGVYAAIVITDGDNISVLIDFHEGRWLDGKRGAVPVGWSMQGMAPGWTPGIARYYFDTATQNDEMVAWLPFGYPDLPSFVGKPTWSAYTASVRAAMQAGDFRVGQSLPHTGQVLAAKPAGLWDILHGSDAPDGFLLGYTFIGGYPAGQALWVNSRPVFPMGAFGGSGSTQAEQAISAIQEAIQGVHHRPLFVVVGLDNGTTYADAEQIAQASYPEPVRFVLPGQLAALPRQAWTQGMTRAAPLGTPAQYGVRDTYFLATAGDDGSLSQAGSYARGAGLAQLRQASSGGGWRYGFNCEGCHHASCEIIATGQGGVEASTDNATWKPLAAVQGTWGDFARVLADLSGLLPAQEVYLRFTAAAGQPFGVLDLNLWHNRVLAGAASPAAVTAVSGSSLGMQVASGNLSSVSASLGGSATSLNIMQVGAHAGDSEFHVATVGGKTAEVFDQNTASPGSAVSYLYFAANVPGWTFPRTLYLTVEYYDQPPGGTLHASYNSPTPGIGGAYASAGASLALGGAAAWKTQTWILAEADFTGRQNFAADFRLTGSAGVAVHRVTLSLNPPSAP